MRLQCHEAEIVPVAVGLVISTTDLLTRLPLRVKYVTSFDAIGHRCSLTMYHIPC